MRAPRAVAVRAASAPAEAPPLVDRLAGRRLGIGIPALVMLLAAAGCVYLALTPATDPDFGWHVANGRNLWSGILLGGHDVYSWTVHGATWVAHEWATDVAMAFLNDTFGPMAASLASAAVVLGALALTALRLRRSGHGPLTIAVTVALVCRVAAVSIGVRPQMLELLYLSAWLLALDGWLAGRLARAPLTALAGALMLLWANTHGSFLLGPAATLALAGALLLVRDRRAIMAAGLALFMVAVPVLNPWGPALYGFATQSLSSSVTQRLVQEWQAPNLLSLPFAAFTVELALLAAGAALAAARWVRRGVPASKGVRAEPEGIEGTVCRGEPDETGRRAGSLWAMLLTLPVIVLALHSGRFVMLVGICAAPLLAWTVRAIGGSVSARAGRLHRRTPVGGDAQRPGRERVNLAVGVVGALGLCVAGLAHVAPPAQEAAVAGTYPIALLPALDRAVASAGGREEARLLNDYAWGGFLLEWRPGLPVFVDGRSEVYGDQFLAEAATLYDVAPGWQAELRAYRPRVALLGTTSALARALEEQGWRITAGDRLAVVLVAPGTS